MGRAGLSPDLKEAFPEVVPLNRPDYAFNGIPDPNWLAGFTSGDGSFNIKNSETTGNKLGRVQLRFSIGLHIREQVFIQSLVTFFNLGRGTGVKINNCPGKYVYILNDSVNIQVTGYSDIMNIITFFDKYPILGTKSLDFADFKQQAFIIKNKVSGVVAVRRLKPRQPAAVLEHLTTEGFNKILEIKAGMNRRRL